MALFGSKNNTKKETAAKVEARGGARSRDFTGVIKRPRITEKASRGAEISVYSFEVARDASKKTIAAAVRALYNVTPIKVATVTIPKKEIIVRGKRGVRGGGKKAYVYLKKGETIEFV